MQVVNPRQVQELRLYGLWHVSQQVRRRLSVALPQQRLWRAPSGRSKMRVPCASTRRERRRRDCHVPKHVTGRQRVRFHPRGPPRVRPGAASRGEVEVAVGAASPGVDDKEARLRVALLDDRLVAGVGARLQEVGQREALLPRERVREAKRREKVRAGVQRGQRLEEKARGSLSALLGGHGAQDVRLSQTRAGWWGCGSVRGCRRTRASSPRQCARVASARVRARRSVMAAARRVAA